MELKNNYLIYDKNDNKGTLSKDLYEYYNKCCIRDNIVNPYTSLTSWTKSFKDYPKGLSRGNTTIRGWSIPSNITTETIEEIKENPTTTSKSGDKFTDNIYELYNEAPKINILNDVNNEHNIFIEDNKIIKNIDELTNNKNQWSLAVKAQMGMGKTEVLTKYIIDHPELRILYISFRKALTSKQLKDTKHLNFKSYLDFTEGGKIKDVPRLIIQIDSFYRVYGKYDLLIIDEVGSIQEQLVLHTKKISECISALIERVKMTPMVYIADANLDMDDLKFYNKCGRKFTIYNNIHIKHTDKKVSFIEKKEIMLFNILNDIRLSKKLILSTGSKDYAISVYEKIIEQFKDIKIKIYTGGNKYDIDPTEEWINYDVIIYTSCICAGNSFIEKHFNNVYGYYPACSNGPNMAVQMLFRCRNFQNLFICVEERGKQTKLPPNNMEEMEQYIFKQDKIGHKEMNLYMNGLYSIKSSVINDKINIDDPYYYLYCNVINKQNKGHKEYLYIVITILKQMGLTIDKVISNENITDEIRDNINILACYLKQNKEILKDKRNLDISVAEMITPEEYNKLSSNYYTPTTDEYNSCQKYKLLEINKEITEETLTPKYIEMLKESGEQLRRINHIINNFNITTNNHIQNIADNLNRTYKIDIIDINNIKQYKDTSTRINQSKRLFKTQQIFKVYDILSAVLLSSNQHINKEYNMNHFTYNEIFFNDKPNIININFDILNMNIYDVIKPYNFFNTKPPQKPENYITHDMDEKTQIKEFKKHNTQMIKWINNISLDLLGIKIHNTKTKTGDYKNYTFERNYTLIDIPETKFKYAVHKDFKDDIKFSGGFLLKAIDQKFIIHPELLQIEEIQEYNYNNTINEIQEYKKLVNVK